MGDETDPGLKATFCQLGRLKPLELDNPHRFIDQVAGRVLPIPTAQRFESAGSIYGSFKPEHPYTRVWCERHRVPSQIRQVRDRLPGQCEVPVDGADDSVTTSDGVERY
jgi:hypothetical protein